MTSRTCATCAFWRSDPGAYCGDCTLQVVYHRPSFDYAPPGGCQYHSELTPPQLSQQSETRGMDMAAWQAKIAGAK